MSAYEDYIANAVRENARQEALANSLRQAATVDPDKHAADLKTAKAAGVDVSVAADYQDAAKVSRVFGGAGVRSLWQESPKAAGFLSNPDNAAIASDDIKNLKTHESAVAGWTPKPIKERSWWEFGGNVVGAGQSGLTRLYGFGAGVVSDVAQEAATTFDNPDFGAAALEMRAYAVRQKAAAQAEMPTGGGIIEKGFYSGVSSLTTSVGLAPLLAGGPAGIAAYWTGLVGPGVRDDYIEARGKGRTPFDSALYSGTRGFIEYATEKFVIGQLVTDVANKVGLGKIVASTLFRESVGEQAATHTQDFLEWSALNPEKTWGDFVQERPAAAAETAVAALVSAIGQSTAFKAAGALGQRFLETGREAQSATDKAQTLQAMSQAATESKVRPRDTDAYASYVQDVVSESDAQHIFIPGAMLAQGGLGDKIIEQLPALAQAVQEAVQTGGELQVGVADYLTKVAPLPEAATLSADVRIEGETMTAREALAAVDVNARAFAEDVAKQQVRKAESEAWRNEAGEIAKRVYEQIKAVGAPGLNEDAARTAATFVRAMYETQAERADTTPGQLYAQFPYKVAAGEFGGQAGTLKQDARGGFDPKTLTALLSSKSDASTFMHETGHFYLEMLSGMAAEDSAPQSIKDDMKALTDWFGVENVDDFNKMTLEQKAEYHEQFAYNFEQYLHDGKAPSITVEKAFAKFARWLRKIYKSIRNELNAVYRAQFGRDLPILTGEVRAVMDRMVASQDQIDFAMDVRNMTPLFQTQAESGMTDEQWADYKEMQKDQADAAYSALTKATVKEMRWMTRVREGVLKERQAEYDDARAEYRERVAQEVDAIPVYKAMAQLADAPTEAKIDYKAALELYGIGGREGDAQAVQELAAATSDLKMRDARVRRMQAAIEKLRVQARNQTPTPKLAKDDGFKSIMALVRNPKATGIRSATQFLRDNGGIKDERGELFAMDAGKALKGLVKKDGKSLDAAGEMLWEAGYFGNPESTERPDVNAVIDAIRQDIAAGNVFSAADSARLEEIDQAGALRSELIENEIDFDALTDEQVLAAIEARPFKKNTPQRRERVRGLLKQANELRKEMLKEADALRGVQKHADDLEAALTPSGGNVPQVWRLSRGKGGWSSNKGIAPDLVAELYGYDSGDAMIRALLDAPPKDQEIERRTDALMQDEYGEVFSEKAARAQVDAALGNEMRIRLVAVETRALNKTTQPTRVMIAAARKAAEVRLAQMRVENITPEMFSVAERQSKKRIREALIKGDSEGAAYHSRLRLFNAVAGKVAQDAVQEVAAFRRPARKLPKKTSRKAIGADHADQIDKILERFGLKKPLSGVNMRGPLQAVLAAREAEGVLLDIAPEVLDESFSAPLKTLTLEQFRGVADAVKQLEHTGRNRQKLLTSATMATREQAVIEIVAAINDNFRGKVTEPRTDTRYWGRFKAGIKTYFANHLKAASIARIIDGGADDGPMWRYLIEPANRAGDNEVTERAQVTERLAKIMQPVLARGRMSDRGFFEPAIGRSMNRHERFAVLLNTGNEGNLQRLMSGEGWSQAQVDEIINKLSPEDVTAAQEIWDMFDEFRPRIRDIERRITGTEPVWVEPVARDIRLIDAQGNAVVVPVRGGYYPILYDRRASAASEDRAAADDIKAQIGGAFSTATVKDGFTKSRVAAVDDRPLALSMAGVYNGLNDVIHYVSWREYLVDANRLMQSKRVGEAIGKTYGPEWRVELKDWLKGIAIGSGVATESHEMIANSLRQNVSGSVLAYNVMSAMQQVTGLSSTLADLGPGWFGRGLGQAVSAPFEANKLIRSKSQFMRNRLLTQNRELAELRSLVQDESGFLRQMRLGSYFMMQRMQYGVDAVTWLGAYEKAISEGHADRDAVQIANQSVTRTQGNGSLKDLSKIERGNAWVRLFTVFYSYMNTQYNLAVVKTMTAKSTGRMIADLALIMTVPVVLTMAIKGAVTPGGGGDEDEWDLGDMARALAAEQLSYLMGMLIGVREVSYAVKNFTAGESGSANYSGPAGLRPIGNFTNLLQQAGQAELDAAFRRAAVNVLGDVAGVPALQINKTIDGLDALVEGGTENPTALLFGYKPG